MVLPGWEESGAYYPTIKRTTSDPAHVYVQRSNLFNLLEVQLGYCLVQASAAGRQPCWDHNLCSCLEVQCSSDLVKQGSNIYNIALFHNKHLFPMNLIFCVLASAHFVVQIPCLALHTAEENRILSTNNFSKSPCGPGAGATVKTFLKLVHYSQRYDPLKLSVERHQFPLCCCNSAGKQGTKT